MVSELVAFLCITTAQNIAHLLKVLKNQKNPRVHKICVRNSGAGNGCANFMDTWKNAFFLQEKPMSIKFLVLGGGGYFGFFGGGGADFIFMRARIFLKQYALAK